MKSVDHTVMARMTPSVESCAEAFTAQSNIASSHVRVDLKNVGMDCLRQMTDFKSMYDPEKQQDKYITKVNKGMPEQLKDPKQLSFVIKVLFDELLFSKKHARFEPKPIVESLLVQAAAAAAALAFAAKGLDDLLLQVGLIAKAIHKIFEISRGVKYMSTYVDMQQSLTMIGELKGTLFEGSCDSYLRAQLKFGNCIPLLTYLNKVQSHEIMEHDESKTVKSKMKNAAVEDKPKEEVEKEQKKVFGQTTTTVYGSSLVSNLSAAINNYAVLMQKGLTILKSGLEVDTPSLNFSLSESISDFMSHTYDSPASDAEAKVSYSLHDSKEEPKDDALLADKDQVPVPGVLIPDINKPQATHRQDDVGGISVKGDKTLNQTDVGKLTDGMYRDRRRMNTNHRPEMLPLGLSVLKLLAADLHLPDAAVAGEKGQEWTNEDGWPEEEKDEEISNSHDQSTCLSSSRRSIGRAAIHPDQVADSSHVLREEDTIAKHLLQVDPQTPNDASHGARGSLVGTELETDGMEQDALSSAIAGQGSVSCASPLSADTEASPTQMYGLASESTSDSSNLSAHHAEKQCDISASSPCQAAQNLSEQLPLLTSVESGDRQLALPLDNGHPLSEGLLESQQEANSVRPDTGISTHCELVSTASTSTHLGLPYMETCSYNASSSICPSASEQDYCQTLDSQSDGYHHQSLEGHSAGYHHQSLEGHSAGYRHQSLDGQSAGYHHQSLDGQSTGYHHQSLDGQSAGYHHQSLDGQSAGYHHQSLDGQSAGYHHQSLDGQSAGYHHQSLDGQSAGYHHQSLEGQSAGYHHQSLDGQSTGYHHQSLEGQSAGYHHQSPGDQSAGYHHQSPGGQSAGYHHQSPGAQSAGYYHQSPGGQSAGYHHQSLGGQSAGYHHQSPGGQSAGYHQSLGGQSAGYHHQSPGGQSAGYHHQSPGGQSAGNHHHALENRSAVSICSADTSHSIRSAESSQPTAPAPTRQRIDLRRAANRQFAHMRIRVATYGDDWPQSTGITITDMALSGFYLLEADGRRVRCFYCGLELDRMSDGDNVWDEHVRYKPTCAYLLAIMGPDMVLRTQIALAKQSD